MDDQRGHRCNLTPKQQAFAQQVAQGSSLTASYRLAYNCAGMLPATTRNNAYALARHSGVAARIEQIREQLEAETQWDADQLRRLAMSTIHSVLTDAGGRTSDRLRAAELLGRIPEVALFNQARPDGPTAAMDLTMIEIRLRQFLP